MRLVATSRLAPGARLARDVLTGRPGEVPLLRTGVSVTPAYRDALLRAGIHAVYVDDELGAGIEVPRLVSARTRAEAAGALAHAFDGLPDVRLSFAAVQELTAIARQIASDVASCDEAVVALSDLAAADAYALQHSIDVTALGLRLARRIFLRHGWIDHLGRRSFDQIGYRLIQLGVGLLLHDVGKLIVPEAILSKPGPLTPSEWELVRLHPQAGLDLLPEAGLGFLPRAVIGSHHERWDGSGYPEGRAGQKIHQLARIAAVADVYDAVTSERSHRPAAPPDAGVAVVLRGAGTAFDPEVVEVFRELVAPYPPGIEVRLSDSRAGIVARVPPGNLARPVVRIVADAQGRRVEPYEVPLAREPRLRLEALRTEPRPVAAAGPGVRTAPAARAA